MLHSSLLLSLIPFLQHARGLTDLPTDLLLKLICSFQSSAASTKAAKDARGPPHRPGAAHQGGQEEYSDEEEEEEDEGRRRKKSGRNS